MRELFRKWFTELRIFESNCEFGTSTDRQLHDKILIGTNDGTAKQRILEEDDRASAKAIDLSYEGTVARFDYTW